MGFSVLMSALLAISHAATRVSEPERYRADLRNALDAAGGAKHP